MRGNATKGRTTDSATCDAIRRALIPDPPEEIATIIEGIRLIRRVRRRRINGCVEKAVRQG